MAETIEKINQLVDLIPYGKSNAISKNTLRDRMGMSDRAVRRLISEARLDTVILNRQDSVGGYYRPTKDEYAEVQRYIKQETARAKSVFRGLKTARQYIKGVGI